MKKNFLLFVLLLVPALAHADENDERGVSARVEVLDADRSSFLHGPTGGGRASLLLTGGWDAASGSARSDADGWLPVYGRVSLLLGAHLGASETWRPSLGMAISLVRPRGEGFASDLLVQYKAEGFTEPEGELELTWRAGYRVGGASLHGEASYGQDPEGQERDAELATQATVAWGRLSFGVGARGRKGLGEKQERVAWDLIAGPHLGVVMSEGHFLGVAGGLSLLSLDGDTRAGAMGLASYAVAY